jgi:hypothetical protein
MIVDAHIDLSESGHVPDMPEDVKVLIYSGSQSGGDYGLSDALAAISRTRLIREGHVYNTEIHHSLSAFLFDDTYEWIVDEAGEVVKNQKWVVRQRALRLQAQGPDEFPFPYYQNLAESQIAEESK